MLISALQKHTLVDYPGKLACIIFTVGCNLRCPFCYNPQQVLPAMIEKNRENLISEDTIFDFLESRRGWLDGVVICGGEPTLQSDLYEFVKKIRQMGFLVKLDTNGRDSKVVEKMIEDELLNYVAVDLKQCWPKFSSVGGVDLSDSFKKNYECLLSVLKESDIGYEYRTTLIRGCHDENDVVDMAKFLVGVDRYCLQQFVASTNLLDPNFQGGAYTEDEMKKMQLLAAPYVQECKIRC